MFITILNETSFKRLAMKINPTTPRVDTSVTPRLAEKQADVKDLAAPIPSATTAVTKARYGEGSFNEAKVNEIKAAIAEGRFSINPEKIADGLIESVTDLLQVK